MRAFTVATGRLRISAQSSTEFSWKYTRSRRSRSSAGSFIKAARISSPRFVFCKVISGLSALSATVASICFQVASGNPRFCGWFHRAQRCPTDQPGLDRILFQRFPSPGSVQHSPHRHAQRQNRPKLRRDDPHLRRRHQFQMNLNRPWVAWRDLNLAVDIFCRLGHPRPEPPQLVRAAPSSLSITPRPNAARACRGSGTPIPPRRSRCRRRAALLSGAAGAWSARICRRSAHRR
jgi:hypothetical protein